jgi:RNA polymerase sigma factor (sigma-70 family)
VVDEETTMTAPEDEHRRRGTSSVPPFDGVFAAAQRGDPVAVEQLLRAVQPSAERFALQACHSRQDAEDAAQEALSALVRRVGALRAAEVVTSWLYVTIRRRCSRPGSPVTLVPLDGEAAGPAADSGADAVLDRLVVADALAQLGTAQREVIVLVDVLGLPLARAAERLGIGERAAKSRLHRARRALATAISGSDLGIGRDGSAATRLVDGLAHEQERLA